MKYCSPTHCNGKRLRYISITFGVTALSIVLLLFLCWYIASNRQDIPLDLTRHCFTASLLDTEGKLDIPLALRNRFLAESEGKNNGFREILLAIGDQFYPPSTKDGSQFPERPKIFAARFKETCEMLNCSPESPPTYTFVQLYRPTFWHFEGESEPTDLQKDFKIILSQMEFWTIDSYPLMGSWIKDNSPFLDHLRTIVRSDYFSFPIIDTGFQDFPLHTQQFGFEYQMIASSLNRVLMCRALYFAGNGEWHEAIEDIIAGIYLEWHLMRADQARMYFNSFPIDVFDFAIKVVQTKEFQMDDRFQELLTALLETVNACPPKMPGSGFYFISRLFALERLLIMEKLTRDSPFESPGIFLVPNELLASMAFDSANETKLSRYKRMAFDWNIVLAAALTEIERCENLSKEQRTIEGIHEDIARTHVGVQKIKFREASQTLSGFVDAGTVNSLRLSFAERSKLLGKVLARKDSLCSPVTGFYPRFFDKQAKWLQLRREIAILSTKE